MPKYENGSTRLRAVKDSENNQQAESNPIFIFWKTIFFIYIWQLVFV